LAQTFATSIMTPSLTVTPTTSADAEIVTVTIDACEL
jgi:hypothetical protein